MMHGPTHIKLYVHFADKLKDCLNLKTVRYVVKIVLRDGKVDLKFTLF